MKKKQILAIALLLSFTIIAITVFADRIGLDHNGNWGAGRIFILIIGIIIAACSLLFFFVSSKIKRVYFLTSIAVVFVTALYVWFVSVGFWINWPKTTNYYDMLATSFQHGQLSLQIKPDVALLSLPDPYSVDARKARPGIPYIFDGSLYNGKFYLYWGPVPALFLAVVKFLIPGEIGDQYIVFAYTLGLFLVQTASAIKIWKRFFLDLPEWIVLLGVLLCGLISPMTWMLNQPEIYEASIVSGQFFLMAAMFFLFTALDNKPSVSTWRLATAGVLLSLSIGSRIVLVFPAIFLVGATLFWIMQSNYRMQPFIESTIPIIALTTPLMIGAVFLGWYNWARFGSILESGLRYQLSGINYRDHFKDIFSSSYIPANFYNFLLTPFRTIRTFPFIKPLSGDRSFTLLHSAPDFYYSREKITGLLYTAPFFLFAFFPLTILASRICKTRRNLSLPSNNTDSMLLAWISITLTGMALLSFIVIMFYYYCTMRFVADFMPALALLAVLGFWQGYKLISSRRVALFSYSTFAIILAGATIVISSLLAVSSYSERFSTNNPSLLHSLVMFFSR
jgi:hypothetical protein